MNLYTEPVELINDICDMTSGEFTYPVAFTFSENQNTLSANSDSLQVSGSCAVCLQFYTQRRMRHSIQPKLINVF
jgi:hypothetical protein